MSGPAHIGILLHSGEGAVLCYRTALLEGIARMGAHNHPKITMSGRAMHHAMEMWESGDVASLRKLFVEDCEALVRSGADFAILPDNTAHIALETDGDPFPLPFLHIAEVVAGEAERRGFTKVGILGTNWTMEGPVYPAALDRRRIGYAVPPPDVRAELHRIIFEDFCMGRFPDQSVQAFETAAAHLADRGCDAVAAVCTEIPLVLSDENSPVPVLDSTRLLAKEAVSVALGDRPQPIWRGGPVE